MGRYTNSRASSRPGSLTANSTTASEPFRVCTFASYCSGANNCSNNILSWISPIFPRVLTLLSTRFNPPTSCAKVCISPSPFCTLSNCSVTKRKDCPIRSFNVFWSFSSTVTRISSSLFSVLSTNLCWRSSKAANFSFCNLLKESIPRSKASLNSFMERASSSRLSFATNRLSSRFRRKSSLKFFSIRSNERCISVSKVFFIII